MSDARPELSVVLPCYNEGKGLQQLLDGYAAVIGGLPVEIILVDNGSSDDTPERLAELLPRYPFARSFRVLANKGYGDGIMQGLRAARGAFLAWSHADLQCPPRDVITAWKIVRRSPHPERILLKGDRQGRSRNELVITRGMEIVAAFLLRRRLREINAQPKVFHRSFLKFLSNPPVDFNLDVYALDLAKANGWHVKSIEVLFPPRPHGTSHWASTFKSRLRTIKGSFRFMYRIGAGLR